MKIAFLNIYSGVNNRGAESFAHELAIRLGEKHQEKFYRGADYGVKVIQPEHNVNNTIVSRPGKSFCFAVYEKNITGAAPGKI